MPQRAATQVGEDGARVRVHQDRITAKPAAAVRTGRGDLDDPAEGVRMALLQQDLRPSSAPPATPPSPPAMDVVAILKIMARRWYVVLLGLTVTAAAVVGITQTVDPTYETTGSFLVAGPAIRGVGPRDAGVLTHIATSRTIADAVTTDASRAALSVGGDTTSFTVEPSLDGSMVTVEAAADRPEDAVATVQAVTAAIHDEVAQQQEAAGVPSERHRQARTLTEASMDTVAAVAGVRAGADGGARYASDATILIVDPTDGLDNPYASSTFTIRVLEETLMAPTVYASVVQEREVSYLLGQRDRDAAPILYVEVTGPDPEQVHATFSDVADRVRSELNQRQVVAGVGESKLMTIEPLSLPVGAQVSSSNLKRPLAAVLGLGGIATVVLAVLADAFLAGRSRHRAGERDGSDEQGPSSS